MLTAIIEHIKALSLSDKFCHHLIRSFDIIKWANCHQQRLKFGLKKSIYVNDFQFTICLDK